MSDFKDLSSLLGDLNSLHSSNTMDSLAKTIRQELKSIREIEPPEEFTFRASSIGYCKRASVIKLTESYQDEMTWRSRLILDTGTAIHEILQKAIKNIRDLPISSEETLTWEKYKNFTGHYDYLLNWCGKRVLLEIKSASVDSFLTLVKTRKPYKKHLQQIHIYMNILKVTDYIVLYVNRNYEIPRELLAIQNDYIKERLAKEEDQCFLEYHGKFDQEIFKTVEDKMDEIVDYYNEQKIPKFRKISECDWCNVKSKCHALKAEGK